MYLFKMHQQFLKIQHLEELFTPKEPLDNETLTCYNTIETMLGTVREWTLLFSQQLSGFTNNGEKYNRGWRVQERSTSFHLMHSDVDESR